MVKFNIEAIRLDNKSYMYWITITHYLHRSYNYDFDHEIAKFIGVSKSQYQSELLQFNTAPPELQYYDSLKEDVVFSKLEDVQKAIEFLQQKYEVMLKLVD